jgi:hypothetical protein
MSPSVCLGGAVRVAFELGAACTCKAEAPTRANASTQTKGQRTRPARAWLMCVVNGCKEGECEQVMGKLSRLG